MSKAITMAGWDDAVHLSEADKEELLEACEPHLRDARSKGVPALGSGAVYPVPEDEIIVDPFPIKGYYSRCYGMDVGWNFTAAVWLAWDKDADVVYVYDCYKRSKAEPVLHAEAIKARYSGGKGQIKPFVGVIDPASRGRSQIDGKNLMKIYRQMGLKIRPADNAVEAGLYSVWDRLTTGRLKFFRGTCSALLDEYRIYRRDDKGKIVKEADHLLDALRYAIHSGLPLSKPVHAEKARGTQSRYYGV